jgi:tRNA uridine 5-carbamoylmethylation protein Kti12
MRQAEILEHRVERARGVEMRIILLSGKLHSGKTMALDKLYKMLMSFDARDITGNYDYDDKDDPSEFDHVIECKGKTVAIRVDGDTYQCCIDAIVRYAVCDVLVLAYSDKFSWSLAELVEKHASQCDHKVIRKKEACYSDNTRVCDEIIALL